MPLQPSGWRGFFCFCRGLKPLAGLNIPARPPYILGMRKTPKETIKIRRPVRRLPKEGETLHVPIVVTRTGRNSWDTADTVTFRLRGYSIPITVNVDELLGDEDA